MLNLPLWQPLGRPKDLHLSDVEFEKPGLEFLDGGGEAGALVLSQDWSLSPLGSPEHWPQSLRSVVGLLLNSKFPMFVAWGPDLGFLYNDPYAEILGSKHPAAMGQPFQQVWAEIWNDIAPLVDAALRGKASFSENLPLRVIRKGYEEDAWFTFSYSPVRDESGTVVGMFCAVAETTKSVLDDRRQTFRLHLEERLRDVATADEIMAIAAGSLGRALNVARVGYGEIDQAEQHVMVHRDWTDGRIGSVAGRHRMDDFGPPIIAELKTGRPMFVDDVTSDPRVTGSAGAFAAISTRSVLAVPLVKGGRFTALLYLHHTEARRWTAEETALATDVAERTWASVERARAEASLRRRETRLRAVFDQAAAGFARTDLTGRFLEVNDRYCEIVGRSREELLESRMHDLTHTDDLTANVPLFEAASSTGHSFDIEKRYVRPDGGSVWVRNGVSALRSTEGVVEGILAVSIDVTARKKAEQDLTRLNETLEQRISEAVAAQREADALYHAYFSNSPEALFVIGVEPDGSFVVEETNPAHEAAVGMQLKDIRGKRVDDILPEPAAKLILKTYRHVVKVGTVYQYREEYDLDGDPQHWDTSIVPVHDEHGRVVRLIGSSRNVTRQVVAEEALRQSQKMEAMGQLTGGVAHDFNNLLTPIVGALDVLQRNGVGGEREQRLIAGAAQSAERARTLVQRLLAFARRQPLQPVAVDLPRLVAGMAELISSTSGPQIKVVVDASQDLPSAKVDPNQLEMAILNLAVNARDAMPEGGTLRISVEAATVGRQHRSHLKPGRYLLLSVADTGIGMDGTTLARAVEPFFSTKGVGKGTGLGLSMVHGLAQQLGGAVNILSTVGVGTNVELWLPQDGSLPIGPEAESARQSEQSSRGTVLLVDDEDVVRLSTADMLIELGYEVVEAASAEEAIRLLNRGLDTQLIITDHLMPGMSGTELARTIQSERKGINVLVISGYAESDGVAPDLPRLAKPFRHSELAAILSSLD